MVKKLHNITVFLLIIGLGAAVFHPVVHTLQLAGDSAHHTAQQTDDEIVSADSCYVCVFSKVLTTDIGDNIESTSLYYHAPATIFPTFLHNYSSAQTICLRGPPARII